MKEITLVAYIKEFGEHWADELPDDCPPSEVCVANDDAFYRLIRNEDRIEPEDWLNYKTLYPKREFTKEETILAAGLSIINNIDDARKKIKLPGVKKQRFKALAKISLVPEDGVVLQTLSERSHYTWWRTTMCNLEKAELV